MTTVLVATENGCRVFSAAGQAMLELPGDPVKALAAEGFDHALAVIGGTRVWRRAPNGSWARLADINQNVESRHGT